MSVSADKRDLVLATLLALRRAGQNRVPEHLLHRLIHKVSAGLPNPWFRFICRPIIYSGELYTCLKSMERDRLIDELIFVHNGWAPQHVYELTAIGLVEAEDRSERTKVKPQIDSDLVAN